MEIVKGYFDDKYSNLCSEYDREIKDLTYFNSWMNSLGMPSITRELYEQATDKKGSLSKKARDASVAVCG